MTVTLNLVNERRVLEEVGEKTFNSSWGLVHGGSFARKIPAPSPIGWSAYPRVLLLPVINGVLSASDPIAMRTARR
jgi:hypothetical protein